MLFSFGIVVSVLTICHQNLQTKVCDDVKVQAKVLRCHMALEILLVKIKGNRVMENTILFISSF